MLLKADPYILFGRRYSGKIHKINEDNIKCDGDFGGPMRTMCGLEIPDRCPGEIIEDDSGDDDWDFDCQNCLKAIERQRRWEEWRRSFEVNP